MPVLDPEGAHLAALRHLGEFEGRSVLEMGCGEGRLTLGIARDAAHVLAFDPDAEAITRATNALPVAELEGPEAALSLLDGLALDDYRYYHSTRADLLRRLGRNDEARAAYARAAELAQTGPEQRFLERRLRELSE